MDKMSRKETERTKLIQEKCQTLLTQMLRDEDNKYCVDCDAKGPRWASWNLGVFLCIRCAGIHRNLGVHISRVKSVNLDTWTPEQVISLQQMGNSRARAVYEAQLPDGFRRPQTDTALESFIRAKYEHKKYLAREWVPPQPPKVDWAREIDEELEKQKRKKKATTSGGTLGLSGINSTGGGDKKTSRENAKSSPLPAPLPKPKAGQAGAGSPKTHRTSTSSTTAGDANHTNDLLGLSSPTKPVQQSVSGAGAAQDAHNDSFSGFLSAAPATNNGVANSKTNAQPNSTQNSLAKEEEDFFNQTSLGSAIGDKDKSGKLTKDSILALYGTAPVGNSGGGNLPTHNPHNPQQMNFGQPQPMYGNVSGFTGMAPGYMSTAGAPPHPQFMTPPNSTSMYNAPVMTAPTLFTAPGMGMHLGGAAFGAQFPVQGMAAAQHNQMHGGIMATGQQQQQQPVSNNINLMQTNQSILSGMSMTPPQMIQPQMGVGANIMMQMPLAGMTTTMGTSAAAAFQAPNNGAATTANLNQQFGNLNIGNVWQ